MGLGGLGAGDDGLLAPGRFPETEIRQFIARAQVAAEERNMRDLRALIADDYSDAQGPTARRWKA